MHLEVKSPLELNDWRFRDLTRAVVSLISLVTVLIVLDENGFTIPFARQLIVGGFLTTVPGYLLLRVLRLHGMGGLKSLLFAVGLSLASIMALGLLINQTFIFLGLVGAFSLLTLTAGLMFMTLLFLALAWMRDRDFSSSPRVDLAPYVSTPALVLYSLPLIAVVSTYMLNSAGDDLLQVLLLFIIGGGMLLACWRRVLPQQLYPLAIGSFSLALLWHSSLVSYQMVEWADVSFEFWSANRTIIFGMWEPDLTDRTNTVLSLTMLVPIIALPAGIELITFFKMVFPLLFTLVPLGAYYLASRKMDPLMAMTSMFLLISLSSFYTDMLGLNRQMVAELFMILIVMALLDNRMPTAAKMLLMVVFGLSLAVSHYGLLMIFVVCLFLSWVFLGLSSLMVRDRRLNLRLVGALSGSLVLFTLLWYTIVSKSTMAMTMLDAFNQILEGLWEMEGTETSQILSIFNLEGASTMALLSAVIYYLLIGFIIIGLAHQMLVRADRRLFDPEYLTLALAFFLAMISGAYSPNIFNFISETRMIHLTMILLAPLAVQGVHFILAVVSVKGLRRSAGTAVKATVTCMAVIVMAVLVTNSGLIGWATDNPTAYQLDPEGAPRTSFNNMEGNAALWAAENIGANERIRADAHEAYLMKMYTGHYWPLYTRNGRDVFAVLPHQTFYFCGTDNMNGMIWLEDPANFRLNNTYTKINEAYSSHLFNQNMVYNAQYTAIYYDNFE